MIQIISLTWTNWFSYGESNSINFLSDNLLQVKGLNGSGKSSIPLILQEVLFGSNSKGIKKQDLYNRYTQSKITRAVVQFSVSSKHYVLTYERSSKLKLVLLEDGVDVSKHTAPNTYKLIKDILGMDFQLFSTLTYQSTDSRLSFLTDTDVNRKRFLINLLNLSEYLDKQALFKAEEKSSLTEFNRLEGSIGQLKRTVESLQNIPDKVTKCFTVPIISDDILLEKVEYEKSAKTILTDNQVISRNNKYKAELAGISNIPDKKVVESKDPLNTRLNELRVNVGKNTANKSASKVQIEKLRSLGSICPTCAQDINTAKTSELISEYTEVLNRAVHAVKEITSEATAIKRTVTAIDKCIYENNKIDAAHADVDRLTGLINYNLPSSEISSKEIKDKLRSLEVIIEETTRKANKAVASNLAAEKHNASIDAKVQQLKAATADLADATDHLLRLESRLENIIVLNEAFSMKGLINYKIENLITNFESEINKYLVHLSDGELLLSFKVEEDKLNVLINSHGSSVGIASLSAGELAKVNIATLLSIRKMLSPINVLFLDEIAGVLDTYGRDALVGLLSKEKINCLLVDHSFSHPLVPYIEVTKENNIARIS